MRRVLQAGIVLVTLIVSAAAPAGASGIPSGSSAFGESAVALQQRYIGWLFGSETNPLLQDDFCGEVVGGAFFLNAAISPDTVLTCDIPAGTPLVASPGGTIAWYPTDATTDAGLLAARDTYMADLSDPIATLDGHRLEVPGFVKTRVYAIPVAPDSFIKTVDSTFPQELTQTNVASAASMVRIQSLRPGVHTLVVSDVFAGETLTATFHINVVGHYRPCTTHGTRSHSRYVGGFSTGHRRQ